MMKRILLGVMVLLLVSGILADQQSSPPALPSNLYTTPSYIGGSGITSVSALPGTCTITSGAVQLTTGAGGIYIPVITNGVCAYAYQGFSRNVVDASTAPYNVIAGNAWLDATIVNAGGVNTSVTISANDTPFSVGMNGWKCGGTSGTVNGTATDANSVLVLFAGTFTFTTATTGTCLGGGGVTGTTTNSVFVAAPDSTAGADSASQASGTSTSSQSQCIPIQWPAGIIWITHFPLGWNNPNCNNQMTGAASTGIWNSGWGRTLTRFVPAFDAFNFGSTVSYGAKNVLMGGHNGENFYQLAIWGAGYQDTSAAKGANAGGAHNLVVFGCGIDSQANNTEFLDWGVADTGTFIILDSLAGGCGSVNGTTITYAGTTACQADAALVWSFGECGPSKGGSAANSNVVISSGSTLYSSQLVVPNTVAGNVEAVECSGTWSSSGDIIGAGSTQVAINIDNGCNARFSSLVNINSGIGFGVQTGGTATVSNSKITGTASFNPVAVGGTGTFKSAGGNTFICGAGTAPFSLTATTATVLLLPTDTFSGCTGIYATNNISCAMTTGGGTGPACALVAGSTNENGTIRMTPGTTPGATGTTTLTFAGTFSGPSATTPACTFNYANTGTGAWSLTTTTPIVMTTRSSTVPVFNWNQTGALTAASTYDIDYECKAR